MSLPPTPLSPPYLTTQSPHPISCPLVSLCVVCVGGMEAEVWSPSGVTKPTRYMLFRVRIWRLPICQQSVAFCFTMYNAYQINIHMQVHALHALPGTSLMIFSLFLMMFSSNFNPCQSTAESHLPAASDLLYSQCVRPFNVFIFSCVVFINHLPAPFQCVCDQQKDLRAPPSASPSAPLAGQEVEGELAIMSTVLDTLQQLGISVDDAEVRFIHFKDSKIQSMHSKHAARLPSRTRGGS